MSRFSDHLEALRTLARKRPRVDASSLKAASAKASALMPRATIWIDGYRARALGGARSAETSVTLAWQAMSRRR